MPVVYSGPKGEVKLGRNVRVYSRIDSNPRGVMHPTYLATLDPGARINIGDNTALTAVSFSVRSSVTIGQHVQIGPGACLWDNDGHAIDPATRKAGGGRETIKRAPIVVEDEAFIGARAIILKGVTIGKGAIVGAGALVTKDVAPGDIVGGNPARVIGSVHNNA
ncbi:MAG: acyltransferase [Chloroflexi bacterium]|nr:acyltransferase [Chloroflexota bacterium]